MPDFALVRRHCQVVVFALSWLCVSCDATPRPPTLERIRVSGDGAGFVRAESGQVFIPWGFNYDHDRDNRLIEDYWVADWLKVVEDFQEMKTLGANVVRVHPQFGKFMTSPNTPNPAALERLEALVKLAESTGLYLDITGLGCYKKEDVPAWYDALSESARWAAQARFWGAVAERVGKSPAIFVYDLINEPVVPDKPRPAGGWLTDTSFGDRYFVQYIVLDRAGREPAAIARAWIQTMKAAIRAHDPDRLISVGTLPFVNGAGFVPSEVVKDLDFLSVHVYPDEGKVDASLELLRAFNVSKPVVVEETAPLNIGIDGLREFIQRSRTLGLSDGWIGFYWGKTIAEMTPPKDFVDALMTLWLQLFQELTPNKP
jgi:hypothetical protein